MMPSTPLRMCADLLMALVMLLRIALAIPMIVLQIPSPLALLCAEPRQEDAIWRKHVQEPVELVPEIQCNKLVLCARALKPVNPKPFAMVPMPVAILLTFLPPPFVVPQLILAILLKHAAETAVNAQAIST